MRPDDLVETDLLTPRPARWATGEVVAVATSTATASIDWGDAAAVSTGVALAGAPPAAGDQVLVAVDDLVPTVVAAPIPATFEWEPALTAATTDPTLGAGALRHGRVSRAGHRCFVSATIRFGTTGVSAGAGAYRVSLPAQPSTAWAQARGRALGICALWRASTSTLRHGFVAAAGPDSDQFLNLFLGDGSQVSATVPWTWAASDELHVQVFYAVGATP